MAFNIVIRTLIATGDRIHLYTGGGIVADSVPEDEYDETCAKALGLQRALGAAPVDTPNPLATGRESE
jgi:anthranilate/para-aminobenzoate synthase component I